MQARLRYNSSNRVNQQNIHGILLYMAGWSNQGVQLSLLWAVNLEICSSWTQITRNEHVATCSSFNNNISVFGLRATCNVSINNFSALETINSTLELRSLIGSPTSLPS